MKDWREEMQKCLDSPYYFYTEYCKINGTQPCTTRYTEEEFNQMFREGTTIKQIEDEGEQI